MTHWSAKYLSLKWKPGEGDEAGCDCWNLTRRIQADIFSVVLPQVMLADYTAVTLNHHLSSNSENQNWYAVNDPIDGDLVTLSSSWQPAHHIGVWIVAGRQRGVIHCLQPAGVVFWTPTVLKRRRWVICGFHRHV